MTKQVWSTPDMPTMRANHSNPLNPEHKGFARINTERITAAKYVHATTKTPPAFGAVTNSRDYGVRFAPLPDSNTPSKLPDLAPKPPTKPRGTETATSRLVNKYWSTSRDRFARLSSNTAPAKLQTTPEATERTPMIGSPISRQLIISQMRPIAPSILSKGVNGNVTVTSQSPDTSHRKITIVKTANRFKSQNKYSRVSYASERNNVNKFHALRSHSYAEKQHQQQQQQQQQQQKDNNNNNVNVTFQDLALYSQRTMEQHEPHKVSQLLYNSYMDVQHYRQLLRDPSLDNNHDTLHNIGGDDTAPLPSGGHYVNYCDEEKSKWIESWLTDVEQVQGAEGKCIDVIDNSLKILPFLTDKLTS